MQCKVDGSLLNQNTLEGFAKFDLKAALDACKTTLFETITSKSFLADPASLLRILVVCFADLKKHKFFFRVAVPALFAGSPPLQLGTEDAPHLNPNHLPGPAFLVKKENNEVLPLSAWSRYQDGDYVGFIDPSGLPGVPGWPARNLLLALKYIQVGTQCFVFGLISFLFLISFCF